MLKYVYTDLQLQDKTLHVNTSNWCVSFRTIQAGFMKQHKADAPRTGTDVSWSPNSIHRDNSVAGCVYAFPFIILLSASYTGTYLLST